MMKRFSILLSAGLLFIAVGCTKMTNTVENQNVSSSSSSPVSTPVIFYEQKTIDGFEPGGTPFGPSVLYRKDGVNGVPTPILSLDAERAFQSVTSTFSIVNGELIQTTRKSTGDWSATQTKMTYDFSGKKIGESTENEQAGFIPIRLANNDGSVTATATMECSEQVDAGPCPVTFHLTIQKSGMEKILAAKDFSTPNLSGIRAEPAAFSPNGSRLFVFLSGIGESFDPAGVYAIDLATFAIQQLLQSNAPDLTKDKTQITRISVVHRSVDGDTLYIERDFGPQAETGELVALNLQTLSIQKVMNVTPSIQSFQLRPDDSGTILQSSNGGFSLLDFASGQKQVLADRGYFLGWSNDGQYYFYRIYDDIHNGLGPFRLMVGSMTTREQTEIVRQTVTAQSVETTTKVGDILYAPVGIW